MKQQSKICRTVGALIAELQKLPPKTILSIAGADLGGYDICTHNFGYVIYNEKERSCAIDHLEYETWIKYENKEIQYSQYEKDYS